MSSTLSRAKLNPMSTKQWTIKKLRQAWRKPSPYGSPVWTYANEPKTPPGHTLMHSSHAVLDIYHALATPAVVNNTSHTYPRYQTEVPTLTPATHPSARLANHVKRSHNRVVPNAFRIPSIYPAHHTVLLLICWRQTTSHWSTLQRCSKQLPLDSPTSLVTSSFAQCTSTNVMKTTSQNELQKR